MSNSFAKHTHRIFQAFEGKRKHAVADQLLNDADADADALAILPKYQRGRVFKFLKECKMVIYVRQINLI
jgi:hypothetical protein